MVKIIIMIIIIIRPFTRTIKPSNWSRRWTTNITGDERETSYLFQQMSIALQRGNAVSFQSTFIAR